MEGRKGKAAKLSGTAILAALVVVFDYTLKFSGLKIPFPWAPFLRFDFTGIPIVLAFFLFGLSPASTTSLVACIAILVRSGDVVGAVMKGLAEFVTVLGMALGMRVSVRHGRGVSVVSGVALRMLCMTVANDLVLPVYYGFPQSVVFGLLPLIAAFNAVQGAMSAVAGYLLFEGYLRRASLEYRWAR